MKTSKKHPQLLYLLLAALIQILWFDAAFFMSNFTSEALVEAQSEPNRKQEAARLYQKATELLNKSQLNPALATFQEVLIILREINERRGEAATINQIGQIYYNLGQYQKALDAYQQANLIFTQLKNDSGEAITLTNMAVVYRNLGQYQKALSLYEKSLALLRSAKATKAEASTINNIAAVYQNLGRHKRAISYYQEAIEKFEQIGDRRSRAYAILNIGSAYENLNQQERALDSYGQALAIMRSEEDRLGEGRALTYIGYLRHQRENPSDEGLLLLERSLAIRREISDRPGEAVTLDRLGSVYRDRGNREKALEYYSLSLATAREISDRPGIGRTLSNIGATYLAAGQYPQATENLTAAVEIWESLRPGLSDRNKIRLFDTQQQTYSHLQSALIAQNRTETALEIAERSRARAFAELIASGLGAEFAQQYQNPAPIAIEEIRQIAKRENATLVEYSIANHQLYIWVVSPDGTISLRTVDLRQLDLSMEEAAERSLIAAVTGISRRSRDNAAVNNLVRHTRTSLAEANPAQSALPTRGRSNVRFKNHRLWKSYELLIEPIADLLPSNPEARLIFIPQGPLFLIPFAALQDENRNYLIEKHSIAIAPSIQVLALTHRLGRQHDRAKTPGDILVVGNPAMPSLPELFSQKLVPLEPLPHAEEEAIAIAKLLNTSPLLGPAATETAVVEKMRSASIIHLATHGLLDEIEDLLGMPGAIALTPSEDADGFLTSSEIIGMKLTAELVIISACNTGRGEITGDGVIGLSRAFIAAGVPRAIVSLWSVPDAPTAHLNIEFYRQMQQGSDRALALRQAMLATMEKYPHPRDWGGFILLGAI
ncbi:MAG: CHAT domain-containing tetratricopeptide repeat protein [Cyanobacteriota bacterium]|nr:CHAT domain-containing tetratricopeptide repeat protein [Cyanobacteriota bacterium]